MRAIKLILVPCWLGLQTLWGLEGVWATLSTPNSQLSTPNSQLSTPNSQLSTPHSQLSTPNSQLPTLNSQLSTPNSQLLTQHSASSPSLRRTQHSICPADIETLTAQLLKDLPSYANRVIQRSRRLSRTNDRFYVVLAGRPEFEPLPLNLGQSPSFTPATDQAPPQQVFFTTLERRYVGSKVVESQLYHWLFLTQTPSGWRLVLMFSQIGASTPGRPPTPPQESSNGIVGQAVSNWLRDCRARAIRS